MDWMSEVRRESWWMEGSLWGEVRSEWGTATSLSHSCFFCDIPSSKVFTHTLPLDNHVNMKIRVPFDDYSGRPLGRLGALFRCSLYGSTLTLPRCKQAKPVRKGRGSWEG